MKLMMILLTTAFMHVQAAGFSQKITFTGRNVLVEEIFDIISAQTGYTVFANKGLLKQTHRISIEASNMPLQEFLAAALKDQPLQFTIAANTVVLSRKAAVVNAAAFEELEAFVPITGTITDTDGKPIVGASVTVKGSNTGTVTDANGRFSLNANLGETLIISSIGYDPQENRVVAGKIYSIRLKLAASEIDSFTLTVNTGYQRIRPEQSTGAVSQIGTKEYESRISTNFLDGLVNRLPGLMINNDVLFTSNVPGVGSTSNPLFNIRGISTITGGQSPLIVVDGYPTELSLNMLDPNEIKSVTILKDAAAATVYGVRASNGVIIVERKQAAQGKTRFSFRTTLGITPEENYSRYRWADNASSIVTNYQKAQLVADALSWERSFTGLATFGGAIQRSKVFYIKAQELAIIITPNQAANAYAELSGYDNKDDYSRLFKRNALTQTYNVNVSGGTGNALYYITGNYTKNRLSNIKNDNNRILLSARSTLKLSRRLSLELTTDYLEQRNNSALIPEIGLIAPFERFQDVNGNPVSLTAQGISPYYNNILVSQGLYDQLAYPLIDVNEISTKVRTANNKFMANFNYKLGAGFDLGFGGIYEASRTEDRYLASEQSSVARKYVNNYVSRLTDGTLKYNIPKGGYLNQENYSTSSYTARAQLNYNKKIGSGHFINGIMGAEVRNVINRGNVSTYFGYNDGTLLQQPADLASINTSAIVSAFNLGNSLSGAFNTLSNQAYNEDRFVSGYSNIVYSYNNIYTLSGSIRIDQSNLFGTDPKYKYKPLWSVGAGWNIHREQFLEDVKWIKLLKLRASYGFNGNVAKLSLPQVIAQVITNQYTSPFSPALSKFAYSNSSLRWEQTRNINIGLDYDIFKNVTGTLDYYVKKSTDLLSNAQIDPTIGVSPSIINAATISNRGIEFKLNADWIRRRDFNWNTGLVVARNTSKVLEVYRTGVTNPETLSDLGFVKDYPVGALFTYRYGGLDSLGFPILQTTKGTPYHTNIASSNSPAAIAMRRSDTAGILRYMGSSVPTVNAGLSNRIDFGKFYFFCMVNYYGGFKVRVPRPNPASLRPLEGADTYWKVKGDEKTTDVMALAGFASGNSTFPYNYSDKYVVNGDYITLADVTLSYSLENTPFLKKAGFTNFEIKCQASNLWTVGFNDYNYSMATGSYVKSYLTPTFTISVFTNF